MQPQQSRHIDEGTAELLHDLVQSVVSALEMRDPHTADHSLRVGDMTERVCALMGLGRVEAFEVHMAAHVHDIGKIALRDSVLLKGSRLTEEEHRLLRQHPEIGFRILDSSERLSGIARIVLCHHERWDGKGYPNGLAGDEIPLGARIVSVCDSVDAMLGKRPLRKRLTQEECRVEIAAGSGTAYDPAIARLVLEHWDEVTAGIIEKIEADEAKQAECLGSPLRCIVPRLDDRPPAVGVPAALRKEAE